MHDSGIPDVFVGGEGIAYFNLNPTKKPDLGHIPAVFFSGPTLRHVYPSASLHEGIDRVIVVSLLYHTTQDQGSVTLPRVNCDERIAYMWGVSCRHPRTLLRSFRHNSPEATSHFRARFTALQSALKYPKTLDGPDRRRCA